MNTIGGRIKAIRQKNHLTQNQLAEQLFVTQQTVARWENNKHQPPLTAIFDLAKLFHVDKSYFFGEDLVIVKKFNFFALLGSLIFNLLFFSIVAFFALAYFISIWGTTLSCLISPFVVLIMAYTGIRPFSWGHFGASILMVIIALVLIPLLWKMTKYLWRILKAYYRYNVTSIVYEVTPKSREK